jgi:hypothetical protein
MAVAVDFRKFTPVDSRGDLIHRIDQAPVEHAEAVLAAYDVLQHLHKSGILALMSGLLSAREAITSHAVDVVSSKEAVTGLRVALVFGSVLSSVDADQVHAVITSESNNTRSLWTICRRLFTKEALRALAAGVGLLNVVGSALLKRDKSETVASPASR